MTPRIPVWQAALAASLAGLAGAGATSADSGIDFQRDIRPVLSDACYTCHGPDAGARKGKLRLDTREGALEDRGGYAPVLPGHPDRSEVIQRITSLDLDERMPPPESLRQLTGAQIELLRRWIAAGAPWDEHWAFQPPVLPAVPEDRSLTFQVSVENEIDRFVLDRLAREGLRPAPPADMIALLRRVWLDLTGLPPTPAEVDVFLADKAPDAYEKAVDRLLDSPRYGERMAMDWLDAARYADSNGYFTDTERQIWPWRDWVIRAFNANMPYDQFTVWQLAGDLLPPDRSSKSLDPLIATGFNRNHMVSNESGIIDEEYRVEYVADRLETTSTVWLGLTVACARCHDHKYDPISQREYFQLFAFFNSGEDTGLVRQDDPPPVLDVATPEQRAEMERLHADRRIAGEKLAQAVHPLRAAMAEWERGAAAELAPPVQRLAAHVEFEPDLASTADRGAGAGERGGNVTYEPGLLGHAASFDGMQHIELPAGLALESDQPWSIGVWVKASGSLSCVLSKIEPAGDRRGFEIIWQKGELQINLVHRWVASAIEIRTRGPMSRGEWHQVVVSYDGSRLATGLRVFIDGVESPRDIMRDNLNGPSGNGEPLRLGRRDDGLGLYGQLDEFRLLRRALGSEEARAWYWSDRVRGILAVAPEKRDAKQEKALLDYYIDRHGDAAARAFHRAVTEAEATVESFRAKLPKTLVMQDLATPRPTHLLERGQYDAPGEAVEPGTPGALPPLRRKGSERVTRLNFARWLVEPGHPLTARVQVNRLWQQCFGEGLVRTVEDFGSQGEAPEHPELLDWLAIRFMESGWDVKALHRLIVTSATYRQRSGGSFSPASNGAEVHVPWDPDNRLFARGPRFRLPAEMIRDQALAVSGLLVERLGGPSVRPYQPPGLWEAVSYDGELTYEPDRGDGLWRRSLYTFWKRQAPPPAMLTFDGPTRETCVVRRPRTSTPLQALVLLNDETYVEAARALAALALGQPGGDEERLSYAFRRVIARPPDGEELSVLRRLLEQQEARFASAAGAAKQLVGAGFSPAGRDLDPTTLAAWTVVTQALLNLDETITRR